MIAKDIYNDTIPALSVLDSADRAMYFMEFFRVSNLPIVNNQNYLGMVTDEVLMDLAKDQHLLKKCKIIKDSTFVYEDQHIYDVVLQMSLYQMSLIAVLDRKNNYLGCIGPLELIDAIGKITSLDQSGSILVLKMGIRDYALSEIAQIIESHQVKILSLYIQSCEDQLNIKVTLKLNTNDLTSIRATFERYNYKIDAVFSENQVIDDLYNGRLDEFLHYLNI